MDTLRKAVRKRERQGKEKSVEEHQIEDSLKK